MKRCTEPVGRCPRIDADAHLVEAVGAAAAQHDADNHRIAVFQQRAILALDARIGLKDARARKAGAELDAPRPQLALAHPALELADEEGRLLRQQRRKLMARGRLGDHILAARAAQIHPIVDGAAGDDSDIVPGLGRHAAAPLNVVAHAARPGIVGGGGKTEIAELGTQFVQKLRCLGKRRHRIERIEQPAFFGGVGHELGDALRAVTTAGHGADRVRLEPAFLPDDAGEKLKR